MTNSIDDGIDASDVYAQNGDAGLVRFLSSTRRM